VNIIFVLSSFGYIAPTTLVIGQGVGLIRANAF